MKRNAPLRAARGAAGSTPPIPACPPGAGLANVPRLYRMEIEIEQRTKKRESNQEKKNKKKERRKTNKEVKKERRRKAQALKL